MGSPGDLSGVQHLSYPLERESFSNKETAFPYITAASPAVKFPRKLPRFQIASRRCAFSKKTTALSIVSLVRMPPAI